MRLEQGMKWLKGTGGGMWGCRLFGEYRMSNKEQALKENNELISIFIRSIETAQNNIAKNERKD
jgi:hypothetical protein